MSGLRGSAFALTETLGDATALLNGTSPDALLQPGSFRGVPFSVRTSTDAMGRRVVPYLYPGVDQAQYADIGALDGGLRIEGVLVGGDPVMRADRLRAAFRQPGPGLLSHPWLGELRVQLIEPAEFAVADNDLGVVRFRAAFVLADAPAPPATDTLGIVLDVADAVLDAVDLGYAQTLAAIRLPAALVAGVETLFGTAASCWSDLLPAAPEAVGFAIAEPLAALSPAAVNATPALAAPAANIDETWAEALSAALGAVPASIASVVITASPAIGASAKASSSTATSVDPRTIAKLLLTAASAFGAASASLLDAGGAQSVSLALLAAGCEAQCLAQGAAAAGAISYVSRDEAIAWRTTLTVAIAAHTDRLDAISASGSAPEAAMAMWSAAAALADAVARDINADLGRLPAVVRFWLAEPASVWWVAQALAGDAPATIADVAADLIARNDIANPALVPAGWIETLQATTGPTGVAC